MSIVLLTSITLTTIVYSAFNTELQINGDAMLRSIQEIRITKLTLLEFSSGAIETYNNKFSKDSTTMYVAIPGNGSMTYEIEITNKSVKNYDVLKVLESAKNNSNLTSVISLKAGEIITKNSSKTFTIKITNKASSTQSGTIAYTYEFAEHINSYVLGNYDTPKVYDVTIPYTGEYKIELWGASGGNITEGSSSIGGNGGFVSGTIVLPSSLNIFIYVGGKGIEVFKSSADSGGFNGGGDAISYGGASGGGATDIRVNTDSIFSRIAVAGGGAGGGWNNNHGGNAGGLNGYDGTPWKNSSQSFAFGCGGTQINGGKFGEGNSTLRPITEGDFGIGGIGQGGDYGGGGGGGGYYGGAGGLLSSGGGGSSYISGHNGCDAIKENSSSNNITHTDQSVHYSGYKFTDTLMIDGSGCKWTNEKLEDCTGQPQPDGATTIGHIGDGYARITFVKRVFD